MAVRADDDLARGDEALLGQQRVLDAHAADLVVVDNLLRLGEVAHLLGHRRALDVLVGDEVIRDQRDLRGVEHLRRAHLDKLVDGDRCGDVVAQHQVELAHQQLAGAAAFNARGAREDFLRHGHAHCFDLLMIHFLLGTDRELCKPPCSDRRDSLSCQAVRKRVWALPTKRSLAHLLFAGARRKLPHGTTLIQPDCARSNRGVLISLNAAAYVPRSSRGRLRSELSRLPAAGLHQMPALFGPDNASFFLHGLYKSYARFAYYCTCRVTPCQAVNAVHFTGGLSEFHSIGKS